MDVTIPRAFQITNQYIDAGFNGTMFNLQKGEEIPSVKPPQMPIHNDQAPSKF